MSAESCSAQPLPAQSAQSARAVTAQIVSTVFFTFLCYLSIGIPLAVLPSYVHLDLGYGSVLAGLAISIQYLATLLSRPHAGRAADTIGPKRAVLIGLLVCGLSGIFLWGSALLHAVPAMSLAALLCSRLALGCAESFVGTGAITWGIGQVGMSHTARVISWNGVATYGALAVGAPLGVLIMHHAGLAAMGGIIVMLGVGGWLLARLKATTAIIHGEPMAFRHVFGRVLPHGLGLALGSVGFGAIATFITLFYASRHWTNAAFALTMFGVCFVGARLLFSNSINRLGGFPVALISFVVESAGLALLWLAGSDATALAGTALAGAGFAMVFPALGIEAVSLVPPHSRGAALGAYSVCLDVSLGITGPLAGLIVNQFGYAQVFLCAMFASVAAVGLTLVLYRQAHRKNALAR